jgi:Phosphoinositide phospholipase C, Ca2+-dependent
MRKAESRLWMFLKTLLKILLGITGLCVLAFIGMIIYFQISFRSGFTRQVEALEKSDLQEIVEWDEQRFVSFPLNSDLRLNQIQLIASHNSYHIKPDELRLFMVGLVDPAGAKSMRYTHAPISTQFDRGIRSIELDIRRKGDQFQVVHVPLVGDNSNCPDFKLALKEIQNWSRNHQGHIPILVLMELKNDWMELDPTLDPFTPESLNTLDQTILSIFSRDNLLMPDDIRGNAESLEKAIAEKGWPLVKDVLGKILFILHENEEYRNYYLQGNPTLKKRVMFTCTTPGQPDGAFILHNEVEEEAITRLVKMNYMVRTRADAELQINQDRTSRALASGAQILTTDFPPGEPHSDSGYLVQFRDSKTVRRNPITGSSD